MASCTIWCMRLIMVIGMMLMLGFGGSRSLVSANEECGNLVGLGVLLGCQNFVQKDKPKVAPSAECCSAVKSIGMKCTCELIIKEIEQTISMEKLVYVAAACGQPIAPGTQCGSYKVPAAA